MRAKGELLNNDVNIFKQTPTPKPEAIGNTALVVPKVTAETDMKNRYATPVGSSSSGSSSGSYGSPSSVSLAPGKGKENIPSYAEQWTIDMAVSCSEKCGLPCDWLWAQWKQESGFSGTCLETHNYGGVMNSGGETSGIRQFNSNEDWINYFAQYIVRWNDPPVTGAKTLKEYIHCLQCADGGTTHYCNDNGGDEEDYYNKIANALGNQGTVIS